MCNKIIKAKIKAKVEAFRTKSSVPELFHRTKVNLRKAIRDAMKALMGRFENKFSSNNSREIWSSIDSITNYKGPKTTVRSDDTTLPNKLSDYYARFDKGNLSSPFSDRNGDTTAPFNISVMRLRLNLSC